MIFQLLVGHLAAFSVIKYKAVIHQTSIYLSIDS